MYFNGKKTAPKAPKIFWDRTGGHRVWGRKKGATGFGATGFQNLISGPGADMQTISIFVGLNDLHISTVPKYFVLLASEKITFFLIC